MNNQGGAGGKAVVTVRISSRRWKITSRPLVIFVGILALMVQPLVPLNIPSVFAAGVSVSPTSWAVPNATTKISTVSAISYGSLKLSFTYNAELLDNNDKLLYGWRTVGGASNQLGVIDGRNESGSTAAGDETGTVTNLSVPSGANDKTFELYFTNTGGSGTDDTVQITSIAVSGNKIPTLGAEEFVTVDGDYKGVSVGFNASNFGTVTDVMVTMERASGDDVVKRGNQGVKDLISNQSGPVQLTSPFVIQEGTFTEASDTQYWQPAPASWDSTTIPTKVVVAVTDENGTKTIENTTFNQGAPSWPTYESLLVPPVPKDEEAPSTPTITTPVNEQYFKSNPILTEWTASTDAVGVAKYQVAYRYDDGHTIGDSTCEGMVIDGLMVSGCRDTTSTSREHGPGESEQGGVRIWVRAFDEAGNTSNWSTPVHYYYDSTNPVLSVSNLTEGDLIRTTDTSDKLTIKGEYSDTIQANYTAFNLIKDGILKNTQTLYGAKPAGSTLAEFDVATLGIEDGAYELQINATDMAGNITSQTINFELDNSAPLVEITSPANGIASNQPIAIRGTVTDDNPRHYWLQIKRDNTIIHSETILITESFTDQLLRTVTADGVYEATLAARDTVGGTASSGNRSDDVVVGFTIDTQAPSMPALQTPADDSVQNFNDFYFDWNDITGAAEYEFQSSQSPSTDANGALNSEVWNNQLHGGPDRNHLTDSVIHSYGASGVWYWQVRAIDEVGNRSAWTTPWKVTIDMAAPDIPNVGLSQDTDNTNVPDGGTTSSEFFTFALGSSSDTTRYQLKYWNDIGGSPYKAESPWNPTDISGYSPTLGTYKDRFSQGQGTHYFSFSACDMAGNCSAYSNPFTVVYDVTPPALTLNFVPNSTGTSRVISGTAEPFANVEVTVHSTPQTKSTVADINGSWSLLFEGLEAGDHTVRVVTTDAGGNVSIQLGTFTVLSLTPVVEFFTPPTLAVAPTSQPFSQGFTGNDPATAIVAEDKALVALSDDDIDNSGEVSSTRSDQGGAPLEDTDVLGTMDDSLFIMAWYWWVAAIAALVGGWLLLAAAIRRHRSEE